MSKIELNGHHLKNAKDFLAGPSYGIHGITGPTQEFFRWFFSLSGQTKIKIIAGADILCCGKIEGERCLDLTETGECSKDVKRKCSLNWGKAYDEEVADFWGLPVGTRTTIAEIRNKLK